MTIKGWSYEDPKTVGKLLTGIFVANCAFAVLLLSGLYALNQHAAAIEKQARQMNSRIANLDASIDDVKTNVSSLQEDVEDMANILNEGVPVEIQR